MRRQSIAVKLLKKLMDKHQFYQSIANRLFLSSLKIVRNAKQPLR